MSILIAMVIGAFLGFGSGKLLPPSTNFVFINTLVGITGSILGMAFYYLFLVGAAQVALASLGSIIAEIVGTLIAVGIFMFIHLVTVGGSDDPI